MGLPQKVLYCVLVALFSVLGLVSMAPSRITDCPTMAIKCPCAKGWVKVTVDTCSQWDRTELCAPFRNCTCPKGQVGQWCKKGCSCQDGVWCPNCKLKTSTGHPISRSKIRRRQATPVAGHCPEVTDPENGRAFVEFKVSREGDAVKYKCNTPFTMLGSATRHCNKNGMWAGERPTCEKLCSFPALLDRSGLKYVENPGRKDVLVATSGVAVLAEIEFSCESGYSLSGSSRIRCLEGGIWDHDPPVCVRSDARRCPELAAPKNGAKDPNSAAAYLVGSVVNFKCDDGYQIVGVSLDVCTDVGTWSAPVPSCVPAANGPPTTAPTTTTEIMIVNLCGAPPEIKHGTSSITVSGSNANGSGAAGFVARTAVEYACKHPYIVAGIARRYCLTTGIWSGRQPTCRPMCGRGVEPKAPQVVGGTIADQNGIPWQVALTTYTARAQFRVIHCGGALLDENWVLTAAHCVTQRTETTVLPTKDFLLYFGKHFTNLNLDDNSVVVRRVVQIVVHESYDPWTFDNDVALIHLERPLDLNDAIVPICLPESNSEVSFQAGQKGLVAGWGYTDRNHTEAKLLMMAELPIVESDKCEKSYRKQQFQATVTKNMFCAGLDEGGRNTCQGDSGGALAFYENDRYVVEGLVSWGNKEDCAGPGSYGGFARVRNFVPWILSYVSD